MTVLLTDEQICICFLPSSFPPASFVTFISRRHFYVSVKSMVFGAHSEIQLLGNRQKYAWRDDDGQAIYALFFLWALTLLCTTSLLDLITVHPFGTFTGNQVPSYLDRCIDYIYFYLQNQS